MAFKVVGSTVALARERLEAQEEAQHPEAWAKRTTSVSFTPPVLEMLDELATAGLFKSRNEAIGELLESSLNDFLLALREVRPKLVEEVVAEADKRLKAQSPGWKGAGAWEMRLMPVEEQEVAVRGGRR